MKKKFNREGTAKIDKINNKFIIIRYCDKNIDTQKMFVHYIITNKNINDCNNINKKFILDFGENLNLSKKN